ncbi:uncharacterized protein Z520_01464 [Fonsecaea multimorphosa CBS 102226]|uniref:Arrestin-like N-terminal domain-containing protein n=1 Tax=Fonsecaea multimorphosa CBS 102226 TaxID=1442371 RepID=A0A0D2KAE8_9EURO|nr:uncharacterized protein Z520_01464 [Fonsecaea multimorphosa CBS 102226]KIY02998.1 hypothetical protein Z520_01464 [Fonsecaea multimorphosa CBS 102226]OAL30828.1 hypothetical protein AYO22_01448 [Fonsecaea multimorphosa]
MIYARLLVGKPTPGKAVSPLPDNVDGVACNRGPSRINGRLSVLEDCIRRHAFDTVQLCLRGVITSSVGYKHAIEDIITLTDVKAMSDFRHSTCISETDTRKVRHLDFYFELPTTIAGQDGVFRPLPLTGVFTGTTTITQNTALNDHRVERGDCEVSYWVEVNFRLSGTQVGFLNQHIQISSLYPCLRASPARGNPLTIRAKPDILSRCRFQKPPDLSLTLSEADMTIKRDAQTGKRHISVPLTVAMDASEALSMDSRQSLKCSVEAKWEVNTRFSTTPGRPSAAKVRAGEVIYKKTTASTHKSTILFRPLPQYDDYRRAQKGKKNPAEPYVATSQLDLAVPDAVSQPSLEWKHLSRTYTLDLSMTFHGGQGAPKYSLHNGISLLVKADASKADDAAKSQIVVDVSEVASGLDSDEEDASLSELLVPLGISAVQRQQGQRTATRTPPPAYFG